MYIDKIYTKLYSDHNWNGLNQLLSEIKLFARRDYEGLGFFDRVKQRALRNSMSDYLSRIRDFKGDYDKSIKASNKTSDIFKDKLKGYDTNLFDVDEVKDNVGDNIYHYVDSIKKGSSFNKRLKALGQELGSTTRDSVKNAISKSINALDKAKGKWSDFISRFKKKDE